MPNSLSNAFLITILGMGLVFGAILLLWGLMALLVRYTRDPADSLDQAGHDSHMMKEQAAVAAVSIALAQAASRNPTSFLCPQPHW